MTKTIWAKRALLGAGGIALAGAIATPAMAVDYPPTYPRSNSATAETSGVATTVPSATETPASTGSSTTAFGMIAGLAAIGIGGGLVVSSRRRKTS